MASIPEWARRGRSAWSNTGNERPSFAETPRSGQESVWDYPRPPALVDDPREVIVRVGDSVIARSDGARRVLETASPPTFYLPPASVRSEVIVPATGTSHCEWKGTATYWNVVIDGRRLEQVGWSYPSPFPEFEAIRDWFAFYPGRVECYVDGERVRPQPGGFYGGWITSEVVGPFKGDPGSGGW